MSKAKNIRNTFNKIVKEARMQWQPGGTWKRSSYVSPLELGQVKYHFLDTQNPDKHVGESAITRALANLHTDKGDPNNPKAAIVSHPFAYDLKQLHGLAQHHERRMRDAQMYLDKDPLAPKGRFKNDAHAASSFKKWSNHLHTLHSDVMRGLLDAQDKGHQLPEGFKGLTPEHVVNHAAKRGIDVSQPFDSEGFTKKVRDFGRHSRINKMSVDHPLYQGWKTPPAPPAAPAPQVESSTMNKSQRIRDIFESRMNESRKKLQGHLKGKQRRDLRNLEAGKGDAEHGQQLRKDAKKLSKDYHRLSTEIPYRNDPPESDEFHLTRGEAYDKNFNVVKREPVGARKSLLAHLAYRSTSPKVKAKARELYDRDLEKQNDSTNYARAGLRALFETVLDEAKEDEAFGPVDPNDPKSFGEKPLKQPPKIKFKPKPANMPKGPIAVTEKPFQRDPLDP